MTSVVFFVGGEMLMICFFPTGEMLVIFFIEGGDVGRYTGFLKVK